MVTLTRSLYAFCPWLRPRVFWLTAFLPAGSDLREKNTKWIWIRPLITLIRLFSLSQWVILDREDPNPTRAHGSNSEQNTQIRIWTKLTNPNPNKNHVSESEQNTRIRIRSEIQVRSLGIYQNKQRTNSGFAACARTSVKFLAKRVIRTL